MSRKGMSDTQAKMRCNRNSSTVWSEDVHEVWLTAVYDPDPGSPNFVWSKATPSASCQLTITNPDAFAVFEPNAEYLVTFTKVTDPPPELRG